MSIITALHHLTHYIYDKPTSLGMQTIRLRPAPHMRSHVQSYSLKITPDKHFINWQQDPFGNFLAKIVFPQKVKEFKIEVDLISEIRTYNPFDFFLEEHAKQFPFDYGAELREELSPYLEIKESGEKLLALVESEKQKSRNTIDYLVGINQRLNQMLQYVVRMEAGVQSCEETLSLSSGSCRDMAWLLAQTLRHLGFATRFASGYLIQLAADVKSLDGPSGTEVDFTDLHAWTEVYLPGAGWIGLDVTSGLFIGEGHIPLCCTPNPSSAAPVSGTIEAGINSTLSHEMSVERIIETPRVTKPYSDEQWQAIDALGAKIDEHLTKQDVRLTMGGEPTFVSIDDREHEVWHYSALGGTKKKLAYDLLELLQEKFAHGGLRMFVQGKWYPGEILPRWAMPCFWRIDEQPIWQDASLLANPDITLDHSLKDAKNFLSELAGKLGIAQSYIIDAREDTPYYLWKEGKLPLQDEMIATNVFERTERERLQALMQQNLNEPVGYVLPLHYSHLRRRWISNAWEFAAKHLILLTGDSPIGLRLPLASLPYPQGADEEIAPNRSNFEELPSLPKHNELAVERKIDDASFRGDANGLIRSAICAEIRAGVLHLFLPPIAHLEHFLELVAQIEATAKHLQIAVVLEGYTPPNDARIASFSVTPDPGVIEVNVQPAANWEQLKLITNIVYEQARLSRLSAEKFMQDGKRVGTGGGNHIVLGAAKPVDSPFLRRPDLLRSMVTFWQNHPSISYLFSGLYIGPTSQAPRIDEARHDALYELEIAFAQIPEDGDVPPWLIDRLFRNLLVDLSGNTHRSEFCIDKLYSPDSERGRLGLLEMRGFEMSPHPQMNLLQNLLIRAFVALFWRNPYQGEMIHFGTMLHDKFMLPHYVMQDFKVVLQYLKAGGYDFALEWFEPFFAFRFVHYGTKQIGDITLSLHGALEPWPVMGEQPTGGGVSRSVDASVERLQVKVSGIIDKRHIVTCNGRAVPLKPTCENGVMIAGVRFKAWEQYSSLHPNIPVHAPLIFEVIDVQAQMSLGGCTYHVVHPGGRSYDTFPLNENEAEGRKIARFEAMGHSKGKLKIPKQELNSQFPHTLDLRYNNTI